MGRTVLPIAGWLVTSIIGTAGDFRSFDIVVYGGTPGGVIAAVAAAREGAHVALLEPSRHLGGAVSGGLVVADAGREEVIGGYALEFFQRAGRKYGVPIQWNLEPHVAEVVFDEMASEADVEVFPEHRLREKTGVRMQDARIVEITSENGDKFAGKVFVDASYEGDVMAQAGVSYIVGREGRAQYGETLAGVRRESRNHQFSVPVVPYDRDGKLLPEVSDKKPGPEGSADQGVQAYNFRMCLTQLPDNRVAFPKPVGYSAARYALLARYLDELDKIKGGAPTATAAIALGKMPPALRERLKRPWDINDVLQPRLGLLPNGKNDTNNEGAFSTDYIGASHDYPDADYATRARIWQAHIDYDQGLLYFLQNDPQVPNPLHEALATWGLCKDEFVDNGNWPYQLYVREGRRMTGEYVMRQQDVQTEITKPDPIGMGSYGIDIHHIQRIVGGDGFVQNEGDEPGRTTPYQIPYRALLPKRDQARNLLVPVCLSASHVAYASLRMEPVYMTTGQAAGVAAKLAIDAGISVQDVDYTALVAKLDAQRAVTAFAVASVLPGVPDRNGIIVHEVQSPRQAGPTEIRMLLPEHTGSDRLPVIYVLPVETGTKTDLGDPLLEIKRLNLQNICNVIFVEPTFSATPWYADNPNDPKVRQETYLLKDVIPFVDRRYPTRARPDGRLLVGFSKSGWGAWTLMLRHPATFGRAAAWDAPMMLDHYSAWGSAPIYGSQENFEQYRITNLLRSNVAELRASTRSPRLILTGYAVFQDHHEQVHALMKELGVPHVFRNGPRLKHDWCSGWLEESISLLLAPGDLGK